MNGTIFRPSRPHQASAILNVAIHNHPKRRTKTERDLIQGGIAPKTSRAIRSRMDPGGSVGKRLVSELVPTPASCCPDHGNASTPESIFKIRRSRRWAKDSRTRTQLASKGATPLMDTIRLEGAHLYRPENLPHPIFLFTICRHPTTSAE